MEQYIKKSSLVAEIERIFKEIGTPPHKDSNCEDWPFLAGEQQMCKTILSFIDTLEVKEVDLDEEYECYMNEEISEKEWIREDYLDFAKHFYELGLNSRHES